MPGGDRVLLFSQFAEMGAILQQHVQETYGLETPFLHGGATRNQRDLMVQRFQDDPDGPQVFVLSLKAGGSGLNLPRANHVIHYDRVVETPPWKTRPPTGPSASARPRTSTSTS